MMLLFSTSPRSFGGDATPKSRQDQIRRWVLDLNARAPSRREAAYRNLIGLSRGDLQSLHEALKDHTASMDNQQDLLHDLVTQVYLATQEYPYSPTQGFLGVMFDYDQSGPYPGVEIRHLIPGLCASKYLEEGDVVMEIQVGDEHRPLHYTQEMREIIQSLPAGQAMTLSLLRRGRMISVEIILGGTPVALAQNNIEAATQFQMERQNEAEAYWSDHFESLFAPPSTSRAAVSP